MDMKNEIRKQNKLMRLQMEEAEVREKSALAAANFLGSNIYKHSKTLMLYMPLKNETDTVEIINTAFADGKKVVFPVTNDETYEITPYYAKEDGEFSVGAFHILEPNTKKVADVCDIDVILVPGIAFSKSGVRVGFGKGCYDRLLENTKAIKVGYCYDFQLCNEIPSDIHDVSMDYIVSECGIIKCYIWR